MTRKEWEDKSVLAKLIDEEFCYICEKNFKPSIFRRSIFEESCECICDKCWRNSRREYTYMVILLNKLNLSPKGKYDLRVLRSRT